MYGIFSLSSCLQVMLRISFTLESYVTSEVDFNFFGERYLQTTDLYLSSKEETWLKT